MSHVHRGPIVSDIPGRTDHVPLAVTPGSYVIPADIVSALGEGNTAAGHKVLDEYFGPAEDVSKFALGGLVRPVDILAAGGEHVLTPGQIVRVGGGSLRRGHEILDRFIKSKRSKTIKTLQKLPGPVKHDR